MILIKNRQRKIVVDVAQLERDTQTILDALGYADFDIGILLTTNATIRTYNREYRDKDKPTDILSFAYHTEIQPGQAIEAQTEDDKNLGDLIISVEYVYNDAQHYEVTFERRMQELLVHGICHLLGHDHIEDADYETMHKKEMELLALIDKQG